ncbi:MAG: thermonuclease family protein, partial [Gaiellaceae bacterium]
VDGDTIELAGGRRVRLLQIDTPELGEGECYSRKAALVLRSLLPQGTRVRLERDPSLDRVDRYGRLLRYVHSGRTNLNVALVERGAASVWFYDGERGRYAARLLAAARAAKAGRRGLWSACPATRLDPSGSVETRRGAAPQQNNPARCDPSYPDVCIPSPPPDLDCGDLPYRGIRVVGADPHRLDGWDDDGVGCER